MEPFAISTKNGIDPVGVVNLSTGEYIRFQPGQQNTPRSSVVVYDSYHAAGGGENVNWWFDGQGRAICSDDEPNGIAPVGVIPMSPPKCASRGADLKLTWDNYVADQVAWGGSLDTRRAAQQIIVQVGISSGANPNPNLGMGVIVGFFERFDRNGDGMLTHISSGPYQYVFS